MCHWGRKELRSSEGQNCCLKLHERLSLGTRVLFNVLSMLAIMSFKLLSTAIKERGSTRHGLLGVSSRVHDNILHRCFYTKNRLNRERVSCTLEATFRPELAVRELCILWRQILEINTKVRVSAKGQRVHYSITGGEGSRLQGKKVRDD